MAMIALARPSSIPRVTMAELGKGKWSIDPIEKYIRTKSKKAAEINLIRVLRRFFERSIRRIFKESSRRGLAEYPAAFTAFSTALSFGAPVKETSMELVRSETSAPLTPGTLIVAFSTWLTQ